MKTKEKKILLVEQNKGYSALLEKSFQKYDWEIVLATTLDKAQWIWDRQQPFDLVIVADCVGGNKFNSGPFIARLRKDSPGIPIVAACFDPDIRELMLNRGCSHGNEWRKISDLVINILRKYLEKKTH